MAAPRIVRTLIAAGVTILLVGLPTVLSAQGFRGGPRVDLAFANFRGADYDQERRTGIRIGIWGEIDLSGPVDVQGEVVYATKGTGVGDATFDLDYIEVPVAAKIALGSSPVFILAGPSLSFLISDPFEGEDSDLLNSVDFGLIGGIGVDFVLGSLPATADVRYGTGLSVIFDFDEGDDDRNSRNQVVSVGVGLALF